MTNATGVAFNLTGAYSAAVCARTTEVPVLRARLAVGGYVGRVRQGPLDQAFSCPVPRRSTDALNFFAVRLVRWLAGRTEACRG